MLSNFLVSLYPQVRVSNQSVDRVPKSAPSISARGRHTSVVLLLATTLAVYATNASSAAGRSLPSMLIINQSLVC